MAYGRIWGLIDLIVSQPPTTVVISLCIAVAFMGPTRLLGFAKTRYWHSKKSIQLTLTNGKTTTLAEFCKSAIPPCRLNPFIFNGHLQTTWTLVKGQHVPIFYKRHIFQAEDPTYTGQYAVDFVVPPNDNEDSNLPPRTTYYSEERIWYDWLTRQQAHACSPSTA